MYCYVVKLPLFRLQRGSAKSPLAPSNSSSLCIGIDASAYFYIPESDDPPRLLSGMVIALFGEFPDPTTALSYFSKKEDTDKVNIIYVICYKTSFHLYQLYFSF